MKVEVSSNGKLEHIKQATAWLKSHKVRIGIPDGAAPRESGELTNVELAFLMTDGSPINRMPPRPFLEPALALPENEEMLSDDMKSAASAAFDGDFGRAMNGLKMTGEDGATAVKRYMDEGAFPANAPITINGGWMRNRVSGKPVHVKGKGSSKPLIDTGNLQGAITYVVE